MKKLFLILIVAFALPALADDDYYLDLSKEIHFSCTKDGTLNVYYPYNKKIKNQATFDSYSVQNHIDDAMNYRNCMTLKQNAESTAAIQLQGAKYYKYTKGPGYPTVTVLNAQQSDKVKAEDVYTGEAEADIASEAKNEKPKEEKSKASDATCWFADKNNSENDVKAEGCSHGDIRVAELNCKQGDLIIDTVAACKDTPKKDVDPTDCFNQKFSEVRIKEFKTGTSK